MFSSVIRALLKVESIAKNANPRTFFFGGGGPVRDQMV